jgi:hypothetical protein
MTEVEKRPLEEGAEAPESKIAKVDVEPELLEKLLETDAQADKLNEQAEEEKNKIDIKYRAMKQKHFIHRGDLAEKIPKFWHTVFFNYGFKQNNLILQEEFDLLEHLKAFKVEFPSEHSRKFIFEWKENPFTGDAKWERTETFIPPVDGDMVGREKITYECTPIKWTKKPEGEGEGFVHWFENTDTEDDDLHSFSDELAGEVWEKAVMVFQGLGIEELSEDLDDDDDDEEEGEEEEGEGEE